MRMRLVAKKYAAQPVDEHHLPYILYVHPSPGLSFSEMFLFTAGVRVRFVAPCSFALRSVQFFMW